MLKLRAEVRPSPIQGLGLFTVEPIAAGTLVIQWTRGIDPCFPVAADLPPETRALLDRYGWRVGDEWRMSLDEGRYVNHSRLRANLRVIDGSTYAARDIAPGEELLEDYASYDPDFAEYAADMREAVPPLACNCACGKLAACFGRLGPDGRPSASCGEHCDHRDDRGCMPLCLAAALKSVDIERFVYRAFAPHAGTACACAGCAPGTAKESDHG